MLVNVNLKCSLFRKSLIDIGDSIQITPLYIILLYTVGKTTTLYGEHLSKIT